MKPEFRLKIDHQTDVLFWHRLEESGIVFERREVPGGGYDIPVTDYQFFDQDSFNKANEILNEFYEFKEEKYEPTGWKKVLDISIEIIGLVVVIGLNIWFIRHAIYEHDSPEIWISVVVCLGISVILVKMIYNRYKPK